MFFVFIGISVENFWEFNLEVELHCNDFTVFNNLQCNLKQKSLSLSVILPVMFKQRDC